MSIFNHDLIIYVKNIYTCMLKYLSRNIIIIFMFFFFFAVQLFCEAVQFTSVQLFQLKLFGKFFFPDA